MAKKVSENDIQDMTQDWGLDTSNNLPYSGAAVQKFIKEKLNSKMGYFHYDSSTNRYLVFADESSKDKYLNDTSLSELVLGTFDAPFTYQASIKLLTPSYIPILIGTTGNYISFTFDIKNKEGASVGDSVSAVWTFKRGGNEQTVRAKYAYGQSVTMNVDKYLGEGTNTIIIRITGDNTLAQSSVAVTYQVMNISLTSGYDISRMYDLRSNESVVAEIPFSVSGYGTKTVEWFLDGEQLPKETSMDEVTGNSASRTKLLTVSNLSQGRHSLQLRAYSGMDGQTFHSNLLYRDLIVYTGADENPIIALSATLPFDSDLVTGDLALSGATQFIPYKIDFAVYNPLGATVDVVISVDGQAHSTVTAESGMVNTFTYTPNSYGTKSIKFTAGTTEYNVTLDVAKNDNALEEITDSLELDLQAVGKTNASADRNQWVYGNYSTVFTGFLWNELSGWKDGALLIPEGASIDVDFAPLQADATATGKTLEFEFATTGVASDNAVVCDLRDSSGTGLLITASEVTLFSSGGKELGRPFKAGENIRVSFVINKDSGVTNKGMAFIYINGIVSGSVNFTATDNFMSSKTITFSGSADASVVLRSMRIYSKALTHDEVLNNYMLYRSSVDEMMEVYDRNDIYEDGTESFSTDKLANQLPVMIVTGDIPALEATTDKNKSIVVDVEYVNYQNPELSFTMTNAHMQPQGTSSMGYPKKNFRLYTQERDDTKVFDYEGNEIEDKLYAFKEGAIPVNCWCMKADYAESSGTHNTGIARLWNDVMKNMKVDDVYVCRTQAQQAAIDNGYQYDVRTTVDGFPILMFYRLAPTSDLVFIGKYNFNNDKSTENVFGFKDIPGFDNSRMQCWEVLNNGDALALFTDVSDFDTRWKDAFESRYPDTKTPDTSDLKAFSVWMNGVSQEAFATEKWQHLDVYKMAAYYIYVMRFGAVDQTVKNSMLTSEDGQKFYFINYDNDTINGLRNDGLLIYPPTMTRQTLDETYTETVYAYAGHDSRLWNCLEADAEFMSIVQIVDNALYNAGLTYANVIDMFDNKQAGKWAERIYNQDAQYKYVGPYAESGTNNLFMLQGSRSSHRRWWLSKRFAFIDSMFISGEYKAKVVEMKVAAAPTGIGFSIVAGEAGGYGYGVNNVAIETGVNLEEGAGKTFTTKQVLNVGDPLRLYSAPNLREIDLSGFTPYMSTLSLAGVYSEELGTKLKKLKIGVDTSTDTRRNSSLAEISGLDQAKRLEHIDIEGYQGLTSLALDGLNYIKEIKAYNSGLTGISLPDGSPVETLELPSTLQGITLSNASKLTQSGLKLQGGWSSLASITIKKCPHFMEDFDLISNWYKTKVTEDGKCSLVMEGINWTDVDGTELAAIANIVKAGGVVSLKGTIRLSQAFNEDLVTIREVFGEHVFNKGSELWITSEAMLVLVSERKSIIEGESMQFSAIVFSEHESGVLTYSIVGDAGEGVTLDSTTGLLTTVEDGGETKTFKVMATFIPSIGAAPMSGTTNFTVEKAVYPTEDSTYISGTQILTGEDEEYVWKTTTGGVNVAMTSEWSLSGDISDCYTISSQDEKTCVLHQTSAVSGAVSGSIHLSLNKKLDGTNILSMALPVVVKDASVLFTSVENPAVMKCMYNAGLAADEFYMTYSEAAAVTDGSFNPTGTQSGSVFYNNKDIKSFEELQYFTSLTTLDPYCFYGCVNLERLKFPPLMENFGTYCCYRGSSSYVPLMIDGIDVKTVASYAFYSYSTSGNGSITIDTVNWYCEQACSTSRQNLFYYTNINNLNVYKLSAGYSSTSSSYRKYQHFYYANLHNIEVSGAITSIPNYVFYYAYIYGLELPDSVTSIGTYAFYVQNTTGFNVNRMSNAITTMNSYSFCYPVFKTDVDFSKLGLDSEISIEYATYEGKLDLSGNENGGSTFYLSKLLSYFRSCAEFILPTRALTCIYYSTSSKVDKLSIPSMANFCASTFTNSGSPAAYATTLYTTDLNTGEYVQVTDFNPSEWLVTSVPAYAFWGCKAITGYDATGIKDHNTYSFYNSGIKTLKLDNFGGTGTIAAYAFASCASLETITDNSTQPWATLSNLAFRDVNASVKINSQVFGLYKQSIGFTLSPMDSGVVYALAFGEYTFTAPSGSAFGDGTTSKTLVLGSTGAIEDLTERLKIEYLTFVLSSNKEGAQFTLSYTASDGTEKTDTVTAGSHLLKVTKGTVVTVTPVSTYGGWTAPAASTVTMSSTSNAKTMDYTEEVNVYIAHKNGTLYSTDEWTASGNSNDDAEGVCVMRALSGGFIIAKTDASESKLAWGGYGKTISGIVSDTSSSTAVLDMDGIGNTPKIIEQCAGYTSQSVTGAPAAEACAAYAFPSGQTGYLPSLGEWDLAYDHKATIGSAMTLIGGTAITNGFYWSSTQYGSNYSWYLHWSNGNLGTGNKYDSNYVRAFAAFGYLFISSTLSTRFTVSYTNNYDEQVTQRVGAGGTSLNVKVGTQVTVTPDAIGDITAEPQTFTWEGFRKDLSFVFAKDAGVYIQHVNGSLHTEAEWTAGGYANSDANGVAILSETVPAFVIAKEDAISSTLKWGGYGKTVPDIVTSTLYSTAVLDYDGAGNTPKIIEYLAGTNDGYVDGAPAAEACAAFTFPNDMKGYLPALGEWQGVYNNKSSVVSAMTLIGGTAINIGYYWSSTQYDNRSSWYLYWLDGSLTNVNKNRNNYVRAFAAL